ncbi:MAG TPA: hypothetical protein DEP87_04275 [Candidatus Pacebacteria bacterium]|nr:hypothetical protein [Candidatus Paceibacterota bacterium]
MTLTQLFGGLATILAVISYLPYLRDIWRGKTKPHVFSWLVWSILTVIGMLSQIVGEAGPAIWVSAITTLLCLTVLILAIKQGETKILPTDWLSLVGALVALGLWFVVKVPVWSLSLALLTDLLGFFPTFVKTWYKPNQETLSTYALNGLKHTLTLFALDRVSFLTAGYPVYLIIVNIGFVIFLIWRRKTQRV